MDTCWMTARFPGSDRLVFPYPRLYLRLALYIGAALAVFVLLGAASLAFIASYELRGYSLARQSPLAKDAAVILARDGKSRTVRQILHCIHEVDVFEFHQKANGAAMGSTTEAVIELLAWADGEGGGLFVVEGTAGCIVTACLFQRDA